MRAVALLAGLLLLAALCEGADEGQQLVELGNRRIQAGDYPGAVDAYSRVDPCDWNAGHNLAVAELRSGWPERALQTWERVLRCPGGDEDSGTRYSMALVAGDSGDRDRCLTLLRAAFVLDPESEPVLEALRRVEGEVREAARRRAAVALEALRDAAIEALAAGDFDAAAALTRSVDEGDALAQLARGAAGLAVEQWSVAAPALEAAASLAAAQGRPDLEAAARRLQGEMFSQQLMPEDAGQAFAEALRLEPLPETPAVLAVGLRSRLETHVDLASRAVVLKNGWRWLGYDGDVSRPEADVVLTLWGYQPLLDPVLRPEARLGRRWPLLNSVRGLGASADSKVELHYSLLALAQRLGSSLDAWNIQPRSFMIAEEDECRALHGKGRAHEVDRTMWIAKPALGSYGRGIRISQGRAILDDDGPFSWEGCSRLDPDGWLLQHYLRDPLLAGGRKFDIRAFVLVAGTTPTQALFHPGYVRRAATEYTPELHELATHLTNTHVQMHHPEFDGDEHVWSLDQLDEALAAEGRARRGWVHTGLRAQLRRTCALLMAAVDARIWPRWGTFQLLGLDFVVDQDLRPQFLEINSFPGMDEESPFQRGLMEQLAADAHWIAWDLHRQPRPLARGERLRSFQALEFSLADIVRQEGLSAELLGERHPTVLLNGDGVLRKPRRAPGLFG